MKKLKWILITFLIALVIAGVGIGVFMLPPEVRRISKRTVDGYDVRDYERAELESILNDKYQWNINIKSEEGQMSLDDAITPVITATLDEAYNMRKGFQLVIELSDEAKQSIVDAAVENFTTNEAAEVDSNAITYDEAADKFVFTDSKVVLIADTAKLAEDLRQTLDSKNYNATIEVAYNEGESSSEPAHYELIGTFETKATNNSNRNTNISNACESVNGTILQPGEQFSYNETLGERTAAKGYKEAGAYLNGEHVNQIGGGICQLSSTLYNALFAANIQVDYRTNHTFEPSYVRPGLDATVSYPQPDLLFTNNTGHPMAIAAHFEDQHVLVEIYGVRTLEEGVTRYMTSEKVSTIPAPANTYQDNVTLQLNQEVLVQEPKAGSKWVTYEVLEKDGEIISQKEIYYSKYSGEPGVVQRNLTLDAMVANIQAQQAQQQAAQ